MLSLLVGLGELSLFPFGLHEVSLLLVLTSHASNTLLIVLICKRLRVFAFSVGRKVPNMKLRRILHDVQDAIVTSRSRL